MNLLRFYQNDMVGRNSDLPYKKWQKVGLTMISDAYNLTTFTDMLIILIVIVCSTTWKNNVKNYDVKKVSWASDIWTTTVKQGYQWIITVKRWISLFIVLQR